MSLTDQVFTQALLLSGGLGARQEAMLRLLCGASVSSLKARLRVGMSPEDCKADFVGAASLYALAALSETDDLQGIESFTAGDVTVRRSGGTAARCLRTQAGLMMEPYVRDAFSFLGV